jgi:hypothetical protein
VKRADLEVIVYFADPKEIWEEKISNVGVTYRVVPRFPWLWLARFLARRAIGNTGNLSYLIREIGTNKEIEHEQASAPALEYL